MATLKSMAEDYEEALNAFLREHPHIERDAITERFERGFFLVQAGAVGPAEEDGSRLVKAEGTMGRAKLITGQFLHYRVDLNGRTCDCADYTYRLSLPGYPNWCKHLLGVWVYQYLATRTTKARVPECPHCGQPEHRGWCVDCLFEEPDPALAPEDNWPVAELPF